MANDEEKKCPVLATEDVYRGRAISLHVDRIRLPSGRETTREIVRHPGAVVIVPQLPSGNLLLIRQYRHAVAKEILEFPAGTLEAGEQPLACAKREIVEETGHRAEFWQELGILYPAPGFCDELQHLFFAAELQSDFAECDEDEIISVEEMPATAVEQAIAAGDLLDGKSIAAYLRAKLAGRLG